MKYIVGASIGGLFGFSMPFIMDVNNIEDVKDSRIEESQHAESLPPDLIEPSLMLLDTFCEYIQYESILPKDRAKECLQRSIVAIPSI
jgi:hypothetical protein